MTAISKDSVLTSIPSFVRMTVLSISQHISTDHILLKSYLCFHTEHVMSKNKIIKLHVKHSYINTASL